MKRNSSSLTARAALGALFLTISVVLVVLAVNINVLDLNHVSNAKADRQISLLAGPERYAQLAGKFGNTKQSSQSAIAAPMPNMAVPAPASNEHIGFENFEAPGTLVNVTSTSQGSTAHTVEYLAHDAGEPSIGVNWQSTQDSTKGITAFQADLETAFVKFDDSCPASGQNAAWYMSQAPTAQAIDQDPIAYVDRTTGRTFSGQLTLLSPGCKISFTDTDGKDALGMPDAAGWTGTSGPIGSGIDHPTIGSGPYSLPLPSPAPVAPRAVYYCSQEGVGVNGNAPQALCLRSDDAGANFNFGPIVISSGKCGGITGHVKVSPVDGTVYVPLNVCDGSGGVIVSLNNGIQWTINHVPNTVTSANFSDPAIGIDSNGRVYFVMASQTGTGHQAVVATSDDHGTTWSNMFDVGAAYGLANVTFPAAVAGDAGRAAVAFYGSTTAGDDSANGFLGVWHLYVAETFDGGATWTTTDVTPNAPIQRGCIWAHGGTDICRNLLDFFDMTVDKQGRVQVGYVNGCAGGNCTQAAPTAFGNAYTATGTIARQSSGKRLLAAFDPPTTMVPGMPSVTQRRVGRNIHLAWSEGDTGNSTITGYQILRGTTSGGETLLTTVPGTQTGGTFDDSDMTALGNTTYFYKVLAVNSLGASCGNNEIAAPFVGNGCTGMIVQMTPPGHPEQPAQGQAPASLAIDYIAVAEPANSPGNFMFQMKVTSLSGTGGVPPNSRWRIVWDSYKATGEQFYVGMRTDANSAATFDYGTVVTGSLPPVIGVIGVPQELKVANALPSSNFSASGTADGTITIFVPKSAVGDPQPGDLLGAVNGRTFTGDTAETQNLERSNLLTDHTFVKAQRDNGSPAATYTVLGNDACEGGIVPLGAVSRKTHGSISPPFDIDLPLSGTLGIECRLGGTSTGNHQVVVTFPGPITLVGTPMVSSGTGGVSTALTSGNQVFINLTGVTNVQRIAITLTVNDGVNTGPVVVPMGVLLGDVTGNGIVSNSDVASVKAQVSAPVTSSNFRDDVNANGVISNSDVAITKAQVSTHLP